MTRLRALRLPADLDSAVEASRLDGESWSACVRRLLAAAVERQGGAEESLSFFGTPADAPDK